jgi:hypothetical protein
MSYFPASYGSGTNYLSAPPPPNSIPASGPASVLDPLAEDVGTAVKWLHDPAATIHYAELKAQGLAEQFKHIYHNNADAELGDGTLDEQKAVRHRAGILTGDETYFSIGGHRAIGEDHFFGPE